MKRQREVYWFYEPDLLNIKDFCLEIAGKKVCPKTIKSLLEEYKQQFSYNPIPYNQDTWIKFLENKGYKVNIIKLREIKFF